MDRWTDEKDPAQREPAPDAGSASEDRWVAEDRWAAGDGRAAGDGWAGEGWATQDRWAAERASPQERWDEAPHLLFGTDPAPAGAELTHVLPDVDGGQNDGWHNDGGQSYFSDQGPAGAQLSRRAAGRAGRAQRKRRRRRRRLVPIVSILVVATLVLAGYLLTGKIRSRFDVADYAGSGLGFVQIRVQVGDGAADIGQTLVKAGVVRSSRAFVNAAANSGQAGNIQPGVYQLRLHSSGTAAMSEILDPANHLQFKVAIPEGATYKQVLALSAAATKLPIAALDTAVAKVANLGIPDGYPTQSAEGFLFPATYSFDPGTSVDAALQNMVAKFTAENSSLGIVAGAKALKLTPYQVLIIASIAEAEAKFGADRAKVARVIMNRLAAQRPLQVDATSAYAAKLEGKDPASVVYATMNTPYNSYTHPGLPPTPIGNPGEAAISSALTPPAGTWLYYVNIDAAGHLGFFTDENSFNAAALTCKAKGWGCG